MTDSKPADALVALRLSEKQSALLRQWVRTTQEPYCVVSVPADWLETLLALNDAVQSGRLVDVSGAFPSQVCQDMNIAICAHFDVRDGDTVLILKATP